MLGVCVWGGGGGGRRRRYVPLETFNVGYGAPLYFIKFNAIIFVRRGCSDFSDTQIFNYNEVWMVRIQHYDSARENFRAE